MSHVTVIGAGAIGSHLLGQVGRIPGVTAVTVIDRDRYEQANLAGQNIYTPDVGKSKSQVHARRLRQIDREMRTRAFEQPFEDLPLGWLRSDVILAAVDSRRTRMAINGAAWRLGVPWIDAGVDADGLIARVQVFTPGPAEPCLECAWGPRDYELVEQAYPCQPAAGEWPATQAPAALGALAASLQAIECGKLLADDRECLLRGSDLMVEARQWRHYVTRFRYNPTCRMPDHAGWEITPYDADPASTTFEELVAAASVLRGSADGLRIGIAGQVIAASLTCEECDARTATGFVYRGERRRGLPRCAACDGRQMVTGFDLHDALEVGSWPAEAAGRSLTELGVVAGDVVNVLTPQASVHFEIGGAAWPTASWSPS
jgi:molybdopterin/thiamine biosynthesis adenylyltransferase